MNRDDLLKTHPHLKNFLPWLDLLNKESARGRVLISTSFMEQQLKDILQAFMIENDGAASLFEAGNPPLGTFSARIGACFALGLISETEHHDLTLIRKIRNDFAHDIHTDFSTQSVVDRCKLLQSKAHDYENDKMGKVVVNAQGQFTSAATSLVLSFVNRPHYVGKQRRKFVQFRY
jgi:mannitol operon repressor